MQMRPAWSEHQFRPGTPVIEVFLVRSGWCWRLFTRRCFSRVSSFAEGVLRRRFYRLAAVVALFRLDFSLFVLLAVFAF